MLAAHCLLPWKNSATTFGSSCPNTPALPRQDKRYNLSKLIWIFLDLMRKGIGLIMAVKDMLDKQDLALVVLGTGSTEYEDFFK
jgi:hypothetical protein